MGLVNKMENYFCRLSHWQVFRMKNQTIIKAFQLLVTMLVGIFSCWKSDAGSPDRKKPDRSADMQDFRIRNYCVNGESEGIEPLAKVNVVNSVEIIND